MKRLDELENKAFELRGELNKTNTQIAAERVRLAEEKYGVKVGSIVVETRSGKEYRVTMVDARSFGGKPWIEGNPRRKDGTFGTAHRNLYSDWELV